MNIALVGAGVIGGTAAIIHGVLTQRFIVRPFQSLAAASIAAPIRRLQLMLLQFSTFSWLSGGIALVVAGVALDREAQIATGLIVGSAYMFAVAGNCWATRGRHPGWMIYGVALLLIGYGLVAG